MDGSFAGGACGQTVLPHARGGIRGAAQCHQPARCHRWCVALPLPYALSLLSSRVARAHAAVYEYWVEKRKRLGKPALRRLQPPPAVTDPNPFNVFRPREKLHRRASELRLRCLLPHFSPWLRRPQAADAPAARERRPGLSAHAQPSAQLGHLSRHPGVASAPGAPQARHHPVRNRPAASEHETAPRSASGSPSGESPRRRAPNG